jgi:hypothetical protein
MPIKLKSTGGGDVTLDVPSTASTYTLTLPASTGTVISAANYGTSGQVLTSNGSGVVPSWQSPSLSFGSSTSWASVSRTSGTTYTNSLSYPIMFKVTGGMNTNLQVIVNGVTLHNLTSAYSNYETVSVIVPPGATYSYVNTSPVGTWILS